MVRVRVGIQAQDPITHAGLSSYTERNKRLSEVRIEQADVVVVAVDTVQSSTIDLLRSISPDATMGFVVVTNRGWHADVSTAIACGVRAELRRASLSPDVFVRTVLAVGEGQGMLPPSLQGTLMREVQRLHREMLQPQGLTASGFTEREIDVLRLLSDGLNIEEAAKMLSYSDRTVKNILYGATKRLNLRNRAHAVSYAIRSGLL